VSAKWRADGRVTARKAAARQSSVSRLVAIAISVASIHALLAIALAAVATRAAEREVLEGRLRLHVMYEVLGEAARVLFYPVILVHSEVYEPRTTMFFALNSLIWGIAAAGAWHMYWRWRTTTSAVF
jgi:hypothetical protein